MAVLGIQYIETFCWLFSSWCIAGGLSEDFHQDLRGFVTSHQIISRREGKKISKMKFEKEQDNGEKLNQPLRLHI